MSAGRTEIEAARAELAERVRRWHRDQVAARVGAYRTTAQYYGGGVADPNWKPVSFEDLACAIERGEI